jgi:polyferredoxin
MATMPVDLESPPRSGLRPQPAPRPKLVRRLTPDHSQRLRFAFQAAFVILNVVLAVQFYLFVRYFESGGSAARVGRPAGVEGWLPIAGLMNLKYFLSTGIFPAIHPAALVLLVAFLLMSVVFRKAFCGWLCPIGTLSEGLWKAGRRFLKDNWRLPRRLDIPLRSLKYILLAFFLYAVTGMSAAGIRAFLEGPYGMIADVKMLNFFRYLGPAGGITLLVLALLSAAIQNFWCRYLCPYGALMGLASLISPARIRRNPERCIDCAKCAVACPALLAVDKKISIRSAECTACLECVAVCPAQGALDMCGPGKRILPAWVLAAGLAAIFLAFVLAAKLAGHWQTLVPDQAYFYLIPRAQSFTHPY